MDVEAEMGRFEAALEVEQEQYTMMDMPTAPAARKVTVALDCLATCCAGAQSAAPLVLMCCLARETLPPPSCIGRTDSLQHYHGCSHPFKTKVGSTSAPETATSSWTNCLTGIVSSCIHSLHALFWTIFRRLSHGHSLPPRCRPA